MSIAAEPPLSRIQIAEFLIRNRDLILARLRRKLRAVQAARDVADTNDLFGSLAFRLDRAASRNQIRAATDAQLWAFVLSTSHNLVMESGRAAARLRRLSGYYGDLLRQTAATMEGAEEADANASLNRLAAPLVAKPDRELFLLKVRGLPNRVVAQLLGQQEDSIRQRWSRLCRALRANDRE